MSAAVDFALLDLDVIFINCDRGDCVWVKCTIRVKEDIKNTKVHLPLVNPPRQTALPGR
jgi:hypothetical protein